MINEYKGRGFLAVKIAIVAASVIVLLMMVFGTIRFVREGERGVVTRNGRFVRVASPGLTIKWPLIESVTKMEVRNMALETDVHVYSSDTQQYTAKMTVNYDLDPAAVEMIYKQEGVEYAARRLRPIAETTMKEVAGKYSAQKTIQERDIFGTAVRDAIRDAAKMYHVRVTEVQISNIDFTKQFEEAIEKAMLAKAKVEEERNILEQKKISAETQVIEATAMANAEREKAKGAADAKKTEAEAEAERVTKIGNAEAGAIQKKADALRNNPELTGYTYALAAQNWNGELPKQFVPGSALPILNVGQAEASVGAPVGLASKQ